MWSNCEAMNRSIRKSVFIFVACCCMGIVLQMCIVKNYSKTFKTKERFAKFTSHINPDTTSQVFCEATTLGCFLGVSKTSHMIRHSQMNSNMCLRFCFSREMKHAFLSGGNTCFCTDLLKPLPARRPVPKIGICDIPCPSADENCGGNFSVRALLLKGLCVQAPFTDEYVASRFLGCFKFAPYQHYFKGVDAQSPNQCLLACEEKKRPLAIYENQGECWCGQMDTRFNLKHKEAVCTKANYKVYRTTVEDLRCGNIGLLDPTSSKGRHYNRTLLLSFPGSGNTWTRYLLEKASGIYTGSVYKDASLYNSGYIGELFDKEELRTDFVKSHKPVFTFGEQTIFIVRNPYRAMLAFSQPSHTGIATEDKLLKVIKEKMENRFSSWKQSVVHLVESGKPFLLVYYEDLVKDPISEVREMVKFASRANPDIMPTDLEERLACLSQETTGLQKRKSATKYNVTSLFEPSAVRRITKDIRDVRELLWNAGVEKELPFYENDPL